MHEGFDGEDLLVAIDRKGHGKYWLLFEDAVSDLLHVAAGVEVDVPLSRHLKKAADGLDLWLATGVLAEGEGPTKIGPCVVIILYCAWYRVTGLLWVIGHVLKKVGTRDAVQPRKVLLVVRLARWHL